jgi:2-keto-4-pentenoate hydratase
MTEKSEALAALLVAARQSGRRVGALPPGLVPATADDAYAVQEAVMRRLGARIAGWKVGAASPQGEPNCAPLFADLVAPSPAQFAAGAAELRIVEAELAFRLGTALPARVVPYGDDEVWDAFETMHVAIELVDTRFAEWRGMDKLALLADNQNNGGFCFGAAIRDWRATDFLRQPASLLVDGAEAASAVGGNNAGHPRRLLTWLANHCARRGLPLAAGTIVTTGAHALVTAPPHAAVTARFAGLGEASLTLTGD